MASGSGQARPKTPEGVPTYHFRTADGDINV